MKIEILTDDAGDWKVLRVDNEVVYAGHSIPDWEYEELLKKLGATVETKNTCLCDCSYCEYGKMCGKDEYCHGY